MIIAIEGIWGTGKTTLGRVLARQFNGIYIPEPDHKKLPEIPYDLDMWYRTQFFEIMRKYNKESLVFLDRSLASWAAFMMARDGKIHPEWDTKYPKIDVMIVLASTRHHREAITSSTHPKFPKIQYILNNPNFVDSVEQGVVNFSKQISDNHFVLDKNRSMEELCADASIIIGNAIYKTTSSHRQIQKQYSSTTVL